MGGHGFKQAFEEAREMLRRKFEPIKPEVEPKRFEKIGVVGDCGKYLGDKKECPGMSLALNAGFCKRCRFFIKR